MVPATQGKILTAILLKLGKKPHPVTQDDSLETNGRGYKNFLLKP